MPDNTKTPHRIPEKIEFKGSTLLGALPAVMVSCGTPEQPNIITVAWTGIACSQPPMTYVSIRPGRFSHHLIVESGEFVINLTSVSLLYACDFCGIYTGAKVKKFEACALTPVKSAYVNVPLIAESPVSLSCRVRSRTELGTHDLFLSEIVGITVSANLLDAAGKLHMERADLCVSMHGAYYDLGKYLGKLGFSTHKENAKNRKGSKKS